MQFDSAADFFAMGGYGFFVWLAFGGAYLAVIAIYILTRWEKKQIRVKAAQEIARAERIMAARKARKAKQDEGGRS